LKLREFDLDLPVASREDRVAFRRRTRAVTALYERCFDARLDVDDGWKVLVECVPQVENVRARNLLGVHVIQQQLDAPSFWRAGLKEQQYIALDLLMSGILVIAEQNGWPTLAFEDARRCVVDQSFKNEWCLGRSKWSRGRKFRADVWCVHEPERFRAWLVAFDSKGKEVQRTQVIEELPDDFVFVPLLGNLKWLSEGNVVLCSKQGHEVGNLTIKPGSSRL
jgi:hypothetical protein